MWKPKLEICDSQRCLPASSHRRSLSWLSHSPCSNCLNWGIIALGIHLSCCHFWLIDLLVPSPKPQGAWSFVLLALHFLNWEGQMCCSIHERFSRNLVSLVNWWCQLRISSFSNGFVLCLFMSHAIWSPWYLAEAFGLNTHQVKQLFGASASSCYSKITCVTLFCLWSSSHTRSEKLLWNDWREIQKFETQMLKNLPLLLYFMNC